MWVVIRLSERMSDGGLVLINMDEKERKEGKGKRVGRRGAHLKENLKAAKVSQRLGTAQNKYTVSGRGLRTQADFLITQSQPSQEIQ